MGMAIRLIMKDTNLEKPEEAF
jgi:hypothetical protein